MISSDGNARFLVERPPLSWPFEVTHRVLRRGDSSEPCRTESTDRRVVALTPPRGQGTTEPYAPLLWRWCRQPRVIRPSPRLISDGAEIGKIERNVPALGSGARREHNALAHTDPFDSFVYREESTDTFPTPDSRMVGVP